MDRLTTHDASHEVDATRLLGDLTNAEMLINMHLALPLLDCLGALNNTLPVFVCAKSDLHVHCFHVTDGVKPSQCTPLIMLQQSIMFALLHTTCRCIGRGDHALWWWS